MSNQFLKQKIDIAINVSTIVTIHYFEFDKSFSSKGEKHDFWEMVYIDKGEAVIETKNEKFDLRQGEAVFHKPNEYHRFLSNGKVAPNVFVITFGCNSKSMEFFKEKRLNIPTPLRHHISDIISEAEASYYLAKNDPYVFEMKRKSDAPFGGKQLIKINLEMLLISLLRQGMSIRKNTITDKKYDRLTEEIIELLHSSIYGQITVEAICKKLSFSRSYVSSKFKKSCGITINEYINRLKINEAKTLIREEKHSISEISDMLCFDNPHYFSKVFKRVTKMSPREYKASVKI